MRIARARFTRELNQKFFALDDPETPVTPELPDETPHERPPAPPTPPEPAAAAVSAGDNDSEILVPSTT